MVQAHKDLAGLSESFEVDAFIIEVGGYRCILPPFTNPGLKNQRNIPASQEHGVGGDFH